MTYDEILNRIKAATAVVPGKKVKIDFGEDGKIFLDGVSNAVSADDAAADTTVKIKLQDFADIAAGKLDGMSAFMGGKIKVDGDMGPAMQLQSVFAKLR